MDKGAVGVGGWGQEAERTRWPRRSARSGGGGWWTWQGRADYVRNTVSDTGRGGALVQKLSTLPLMLFVKLLGESGETRDIDKPYGCREAHAFGLAWRVGFFHCSIAEENLRR